MHTVFDATMNLYNPYGTKHPCRECEHWGGPVNGTNHAVCLRDCRVTIQANGEHGCVFWVRAPGADDDGDSDVRIWKS